MITRSETKITEEVAQAKVLHSEPHPALQPRHLTQNLVGPNPMTQSVADFRIGPLGSDWMPTSDPDWLGNLLHSVA